jgi:hypothetical protein
MQRTEWVRPVVVALVAALASGCYDAAEVARDRARNEFHCPPERVVLSPREDLSPYTFDIDACGQRARYTCPRPHRLHEAACVREPAPPDVTGAPAVGTEGCAGSVPPRTAGGCTASSQCAPGLACLYLASDPSTDTSRGRCIAPPDPACEMIMSCGAIGVCGYDDLSGPCAPDAGRPR